MSTHPSRERAPEFVRRRVQCLAPSGLHSLSYVEWGRKAQPRPVVLCVHGLTRSGRDFDFLARALADRCRVVCPDLPGRGESDWLASPSDYAMPVYVADMVTLIARLDVDGVYWVGTSLGGMIGMALASLPDTPVRRLVLNDVGPRIPAAALDRIGRYLGKAPEFPSFEAAEEYVRMVSATFGPHSDAEWRFLTENVVRATGGGGFRMRYDPAIAVNYGRRAPGEDIDLWPVYDAIRAPTLVLRGAESDLLTAETAAEMKLRGPKAQCIEFPGVGHAPTLIRADQVEAVRRFLEEAPLNA